MTDGIAARVQEAERRWSLGIVDSVADELGWTEAQLKEFKTTGTAPSDPVEQHNPFLAGVPTITAETLKAETIEAKPPVAKTIPDPPILKAETIKAEEISSSGSKPKPRAKKRPVADRSEIEGASAYERLTTEIAYWLHYSRWAAVKRDGRWRIWSTQYEVLGPEPNDFSPKQYDEAVARAAALNDAESELGLEIHRARQERSKA